MDKIVQRTNSLLPAFLSVNCIIIMKLDIFIAPTPNGLTPDNYSNLELLFQVIIPTSRHTTTLLRLILSSNSDQKLLFEWKR